MAQDGIEVHGIPELQRGSRRLFDNIDQGAGSAFRTVADQVATIVRSRVPRRTGRLAGSVISDQADQGALVGLGDGVPYAGWIEFGGTRGRPYVPMGRFLYPTATDAAPLLQRAGEQVATDEIRRMAWPPVTGA